MSDEYIYSTDTWDYLGDMPYMPSREDRDQLIQAGEENRVRIWDYFFRINPDDVGKPQKREIEDINKRISVKILQHNQKQQDIKFRIKRLKRDLLIKRLKNFFYGVGTFLLAGILYKIILDYDLNFRYSYTCISLLIFLGILMWLTIGLVGWIEKREVKDLVIESRDLSENHNLTVKKEVARKNALRAEIKALKKQIPICPSDNWVREWLRGDFQRLWERSIEVTALGNRLIKIESDEFDERGNRLIYPNPIYVFGPGELQHPDKIPMTFSKEIRPNLEQLANQCTQ